MTAPSAAGLRSPVPAQRNRQQLRRRLDCGHRLDDDVLPNPACHWFCGPGARAASDTCERPGPRRRLPPRSGDHRGDRLRATFGARGHCPGTGGHEPSAGLEIGRRGRIAHIWRNDQSCRLCDPPSSRRRRHTRRRGGWTRRCRCWLTRPLRWTPAASGFCCRCWAWTGHRPPRLGGRRPRRGVSPDAVRRLVNRAREIARRAGPAQEREALIGRLQERRTRLLARLERLTWGPEEVSVRLPEVSATLQSLRWTPRAFSGGTGQQGTRPAPLRARGTRLHGRSRVPARTLIGVRRATTVQNVDALYLLSQSFASSRVCAS
jgi:hypothetical protein